MTSIPRQHHFVTKAYLEGFLEPGEKHLVCYVRKKIGSFLSTPRDLANIRDFHSFRRPEGTIDSSLETRIEREIESPGIPLVPQRCNFLGTSECGLVRELNADASPSLPGWHSRRE